MLFAVTRFSVFNPGSQEWVLSKGKNLNDGLIQEYKKNLYNEDRLNIRIKILKEFSIPILAKDAEKYNLMHIIQFSESLPTKFKQELINLSREYSFIKLLEVDYENKGKHNKTVNMLMQEKLLNTYHDEIRVCFGYFLLDDDDVVSTDFLDNISRYCISEFSGMSISFGKGVSGYYDYENNAIVNLRESYLPKINIGFTSICEFNTVTKEMMLPAIGNHMQRDKVVPIVLDSRNVSYCWLRHLWQDTAEKHQTEQNKLNKINKDLDGYPLLKNSRITSLFPGLPFSLEKLKDTCLVDERTVLSKNSIKYDVDLQSSSVCISYSMECDNFVKERAALICVEFNANHDDLENLFTLSTDSSIGYYRYLNLIPGENDGDLLLDLPEGVFLIKVGFREWMGGGKIELLKLGISDRASN